MSGPTPAGSTESDAAGIAPPTSAAIGVSTFVLGFGTLVSHGFGLSLVPAMLPRIDADLEAGYGLLGVAIALGLGTYSAGALASPRILGRIPTRSLLIGTYTATGVGLLAAGAAGSAPALTVAVVILGFSAPVSWNTTLHVARATVAPHRQAAVMAGASSGAALGVLANGILVQTSSDLHSWRVSFVFAAAVALIPIASALLLYRRPIDRPQPAAIDIGDPGYRAAIAGRPGRIVFAAGAVAGTAGFPFSVFLTATAIDEMQVTSIGAASLWWIIGGVGTLAGPILGRLGDRATPLMALFVGAAAYAAGLATVVTVWGYGGLVLAAVGFAVMNYPIWGLAGAIASRHFDRQTAVRSISLGLVGAALGGAFAIAAAGAWIEATGSFRGPAVVILVMVSLLVVWYSAVIRSGGI